MVARISGDNIVTTWNAPTTSESNRWLSHSREDFGYYGTGAGDVATYVLAHRFTNEQMDHYRVYGALINKITFYPVDKGNFSVIIYGGGSGDPSNPDSNYHPGYILHEQPFEITETYDWHEVILDKPVPMPLIGDLIYGIKFTNTGGFPMGADIGPRVEGFGNVCSWIDGGGNEIWTTLYRNAPTQANDVNFMLKVSILGAPLNSPPTTNSTNRSLLGYSLYKSNTKDISDRNKWISVASNITETTYTEAVWAGLAYSEYRYIVEANYTDDNISYPAFSNKVGQNVGENDVSAVPTVTALGKNYPNPFNPITTIEFSISGNESDQNVVINIYNIKGQKVRSLVDGMYPPGNHSVQWNGVDDKNRSAGSGIYLYRMQTEGYTSTQKMLLIK